MVSVVVREATSKIDIEAAFALRQQVFVGEQKCDASREIDEWDSKIGGEAGSPQPLCFHFVALPADGDLVTATARLVSNYPEVGMGKVGRVAVRRDLRGQGLGKQIMSALETKAREIGLSKLKLHSQCDKVAFYEKSGFRVLDADNVFYEENIPHLAMIKDLQ